MVPFEHFSKTMSNNEEEIVVFLSLTWILTNSLIDSAQHKSATHIHEETTISVRKIMISHSLIRQSLQVVMRKSTLKNMSSVRLKKECLIVKLPVKPVIYGGLDI